MIDRINTFKTAMKKKGGSLSWQTCPDWWLQFIHSCRYLKDLQILYSYIYADFDEDDVIGREDLRKLIDKLTGKQNKLGERDMDQLIESVSYRPYLIDWLIDGWIDWYRHLSLSLSLSLLKSMKYVYICSFFHQVIAESDIDNDDGLSFAEFENMMMKNPEFVTWALYSIYSI